MGERLRVASFNANSIRSRIDIILNWMKQHDPDAVCIQETKATDQDFPIAAITEAGYNCAFWGQKSYNGVAIITKEEPQDVKIGLGREPEDQEARVIRVTVKGVAIVNTYVPQGTSTDSPKFQYKLNWIMGMRDYFSQDYTPDDPIIWAGDFNVAPEPLDVYDPEGLIGSVCYHPDEHKALDYAKKWGFVDVFRKHHAGEGNLYSFWDYRVPNGFKRRLGWRLDHIWATNPLAERSVDSWIDTQPRTLEKPSDHTFIVADFEL